MQGAAGGSAKGGGGPGPPALEPLCRCRKRVSEGRGGRGKIKPKEGRLPAQHLVELRCTLSARGCEGYWSGERLARSAKTSGPWKGGAFASWGAVALLEEGVAAIRDAQEEPCQRRKHGMGSSRCRFCGGSRALFAHPEVDGPFVPHLLCPQTDRAATLVKLAQLPLRKLCGFCLIAHLPRLQAAWMGASSAEGTLVSQVTFRCGQRRGDSTLPRRCTAVADRTASRHATK